MKRTERLELWTKPVSLDGRYDDDQDLKRAAHCMIVARRALSTAMPADLIHDPVLDMMLALFMATGCRMSRASLHAATTVNDGVAGRWVDVGLANGTLEMPADRVGDVRLTRDGVAMMRSALQAVIDSQRVLIAQDLH